jgi:hypothetical protein
MRDRHSLVRLLRPPREYILESNPTERVTFLVRLARWHRSPQEIYCATEFILDRRSALGHSTAARFPD